MQNPLSLLIATSLLVMTLSAQADHETPIAPHQPNKITQNGQAVAQALNQAGQAQNQSDQAKTQQEQAAAQVQSSTKQSMQQGVSQTEDIANSVRQGSTAIAQDMSQSVSSVHGA